MIIFLTVIITLLIVILLEYIFFKLSIPYFAEIIKKAIDISCYENTFHYMETEEERIRDGKNKYVKSLFKDKITIFKNLIIIYFITIIVFKYVNQKFRISWNIIHINYVLRLTNIYNFIFCTLHFTTFFQLQFIIKMFFYIYNIFNYVISW